MRSFILALALAAPVSAVAASPTYVNPESLAHHAQQQVVLLTFVNYTSQDGEVQIGDTQYKLRNDSVLHLYVPVGSMVRVYTTQSPKLYGEQRMQVSASDAGKSVLLQ